MPKVFVSAYDSKQDLTEKKNGVNIGEATTYDEFLKILRRSGKKILGYTTEGGENLDYTGVERLFGRKPYPPRSSEGGEE